MVIRLLKPWMVAVAPWLLASAAAAADTTMKWLPVEPIELAVNSLGSGAPAPMTRMMIRDHDRDAVTGKPAIDWTQPLLERN
jgi:hypothetical protein